MKVLHLLQSNRFSGAENVVCQIINMMKKYPEYEMVYCSADGQIREALQERGIRFVPMQKLCTKEVRRVLKQEKPDIVHAHDMGASFYAALVCGKTKLISHIHNNAFDSRGISLKSIAYLSAAWKARQIFWVSRSAFEGYKFRKWFERKSSVLYNIINIDALYQRMQQDEKEYPYAVVFLGRLTYPKNPQRMIRVLAKVVEQKPDVKIAVIGQGELGEETKALCSKLKLDSNVSFLGFQSNPLKILHDAKVMLMTSRWEGLPMCVLESLALGVPIVSTPTDGVKERLEEGKSGFLSDDDDVLARRILQVLSDASLQTQMSAYAKEKSLEINDTEIYCNCLVEAYNK
ncbi:MAG: glycosyltransferase [Oscillospiraceae bacterium]|nr:glycosyltransferase [Oscillospiraceae bacterium]